MEKLLNRQALDAAYDRLIYKRDFLENHKSEEGYHEILVCGGTGCMSSRSAEIVSEFNKVIQEHDLNTRIFCHITGCLGFCEKGPIVKVLPDNVFYVNVKPLDVYEIVSSHLLNNIVVSRLLYEHPQTHQRISHQDEIPFYGKQYRQVLRHCGMINPEVIEDYLALGGYRAMAKALFDLEPQEVISIITESGLRGRGGAGFPTGLKWNITAQQENETKYVICNADEGDPGAFMDRSLIEGDPHSLIEAMIIGGYAMGASNGIVYIRAEYPLAIKRLSLAINQARAVGLLGSNILGSGFDFDVKLRFGAGAFVCGEETALIASIEGKRGEPNPKPPYPSVSGLYGKPTCINNVETLVNVPMIVEKGADWFRSRGTTKSPGTKVFALAGKINNVGLVEVPMGITLREIIYEIGGGIKNNHQFKAVQTGGPSGGCISFKNLDVEIDFEALHDIGSIMGSGGLIVMDEENCMVDIAKFYLEFTLDESCGKCAPCRIGNKRLYEILNRISLGQGKESDIELLKELSITIKESSLCGLGQTSPNPVLSTIENFEEEYREHIHDKHCQALVCSNLFQYFIEETCIGCTKCARNCPVDCIEGSVKKVHFIDPNECIRCGACYDACPVGAISRH